MIRMRNFSASENLRRWVLLAAGLMVFSGGCQQEYEELVLPPETEQLRPDSNLTGLMKKVTSPSGSPDGSIECVDFGYPFRITAYDTNRQLQLAIEVEDDDDLEDFLEDLEDGLIANIHYPLTVEFGNNDSLVVQNNNELEAALGSCRDDDDDDDDDDDNDDDDDDDDDDESDDNDDDDDDGIDG
jgi:hypothetical protein